MNNGLGFNRGNTFNRFGNQFGNRFGDRDCWNCGFGFHNRWGWGGGWGWGFGWGGWGWGWPWLGFGVWDPFWYDPWWTWAPPAYGYYAPGYVYGYPPDSGYYAPDDNSAPPPQDQYDQNQYDQNEQYNQAPPNGNWATPNGPNPSAAPSSAGLAVPVLVYMKNGSVLTVRDYWMIDGELHYILMSGVQRTTSLEAVDLPRTNTENAKSGVKFIFKSEPSAPSAEPDGSAAPPPQPDSSQPRIGAEPEGRT